MLSEFATAESQHLNAHLGVDDETSGNNSKKNSRNKFPLLRLRKSSIKLRRSQSAGHPPTALAVEDESGTYEARRSVRRNINTAEADEDTWIEHLTVVETSNEVKPSLKFNTKENAKVKSAHIVRKYILRSYFESQKSGKRVWDEPPSGASNIVHASNEMMAMANIQLNDFKNQLTEWVPNDGNCDDDKTERKSSKKKGKIFGLKNRKASPKSSSSNQYKDTRSQRASGNTNDQALQTALELSLATATPLDNNQQQPNSFAASLSGNHSDDLELAKALSMSEQEDNMILSLNNNKNDKYEINANIIDQSTAETEDEMLLRHVMEQSLLDETEKLSLSESSNNKIVSPNNATSNNSDSIKFDELDNNNNCTGSINNSSEANNITEATTVVGIYSSNAPTMHPTGINEIRNNSRPSQSSVRKGDDLSDLAGLV